MNRPVHRVVVLALDGVVPFDLGIPAHIFGIARGPDGAPLYEVLTASLDGRPVRTDADFSVAVSQGAEVLATADTVVVPAAHGSATEACAGGQVPRPLADGLRRIPPGTRWMAISTGAYILAAAGVLDGRAATTHWRAVEHFGRTFPSVDLEPNVPFVDAGDVLTSASAVAAIDMCLHVLRRDHGVRVANSVARHRMVREASQETVTAPVDAPALAEMTTAPTRAWALENLHLPLSLAQLAAHAHMSRRSFTRHFRDEVGTSPARWLTQQRVDLAQHLLEATDMTVEEVAERAGFGTATSLRQHLQAATGVPPVTYRRTYRVVQAMAPTE